MKFLGVMIAVFVVVGVQSQGQTQDAVPSTKVRVEPTPYSLATTLLHTLSLAASARDTLAGINSTGNPITDSMNAIVAERGAVSRLKEATSLLEQFREAHDEPVRTAAEDLKGIYQTVADRLLAGVVMWEKFAKTKTTDDIAALVPESSKNASEVQEAWRLLPLGVAGVTHALVDSGRLTDGKLSYLRLTRAERTRLSADIKALFPNVRPEQKGGQIVDVSVNLFRAFLNSGWKSSDDR